MAVFSWVVDLASASGEHEFKARTVQFGDGYEQRTRSLNIKPKMQTWQVRKTGKLAEIQAIKTFLDARAGVESFFWRPPSASADIKVVVDKYTETPMGAGLYALSFTFREVFE